MEWILNLVGQGHPHTACLALAVKLFFILWVWGRGVWGGKKRKKRSPVLLKLSAPMRSAPENVVTAPLDKGKKKGGVGSERQGESSGGKRRGGCVGVCVGELAASRVIYLPNQDTMSRL